MTFGATFAVPGGYIADDHSNGGLPILARRYTFDALITSNTLAFDCPRWLIGYRWSHAVQKPCVQPSEPQNVLRATSAGAPKSGPLFLI
jgi:hypothetical protein